MRILLASVSMVGEEAVRAQGVGEETLIMQDHTPLKNFGFYVI